MGTFASIQARVETRVIDLPTAVQAEVPTLVNEAMRLIQQEHNFKAMEDELETITTVATRVLTAIPARFKEFRGEPWYETDDGFIVRMVLASSREAIWVEVDDEAEGFPRFLLDGLSDDAGTRNVEVYPLPDGNSDYGDGEYRITIPYWRYVPELSADADTNWFTVNAEEWLVEKATAEAFLIDWDEERAAMWLQKAEASKKRVVKLDKVSRVAHVRTLVPLWRGARAPMLRS